MSSTLGTSFCSVPFRWNLVFWVIVPALLALSKFQVRTVLHDRLESGIRASIAITGVAKVCQVSMPGGLLNDRFFSNAIVGDAIFTQPTFDVKYFQLCTIGCKCA